MSSSFLKMRELPFDLVVEILARVPVKDLIRFRCVCKSWRKLFQDERFIRRQMSHARRRILSFRGIKIPPCHFYYESGKSERAILEEVDLNIGDKSLLPRSFVMGSCHGLFFLYFLDNTFGIWNPSLRELRRIQTGHVNNWAEIGFGYDYSTQDYKIVLLVTDDKISCSKAQVLSLKSGVSRMIDFPCFENFVMCHGKRPGTLVGENIYWQVYCDNKANLAGTMLSFDLVSETFTHYPGPSTGGQPRPLVLEEFRGGLCTVGIEEGNLGDELVIWSAQHEKGVIKSWSKIFMLSWGIIETSISRSGWLLGAVTYEGLLVFVVGGGPGGREAKLLAYNLEENSLRIVETSLSLDRCGLLQTYIETLVPIPGKFSCIYL